MFIPWQRWMGKVGFVLLCLVLVLTTCVSLDTPVQANTVQPAPVKLVKPVKSNSTTTAAKVKATATQTTTAFGKAAAFEQEAVPAWVPNLHWGSRGGYVWSLQTKLKRLGFYPYNVTGYYGPVTRQCVKNFQWRYSIRVDGIAGRVTHSMISHALVKQRLINDTYRYRGVPYVWGGKTPAGFDCSGFIYYMFRKHGVYISYKTSRQLFHSGYYIKRNRLRQGDLVFYSIGRPGVVTHVGLYMGNNQFISATSSKGIAIYSMSNPYWAPHYMGARRIY